MQRYAVWVFSAVVALAAFAIGRAIGLGEVIILVLAAAGAIVGSIVGTLVMQRLSGEAAKADDAPQRRGSGKTEA